MSRQAAGAGDAVDSRPQRPAPGTTRVDSAGCELYSPGHQMHYKHQGAAVRSPSTQVQHAFVHETRVTLVLDSSAELVWRHHDPERLRRILELVRGRCVAYPEQHAMRVGPYWFNCATDPGDWQECRSVPGR